MFGHDNGPEKTPKTDKIANVFWWFFQRLQKQPQSSKKEYFIFSPEKQ